MNRQFALSITVSAAFSLAAAPLEAQVLLEEPHRFEISPIAGYQWGGSFETDAFDVIPSGSLRLNDSFVWGAILSFLAQPGSAVELSYLRQDTDIEFDPITGSTVDLGGFAVNYIQIGGRQEFATQGRVRPFLSGSLGVGILDPKVEGFGSDTRFSWSIGGGLKYMAGESQRIGIRTDVKLWVTPVPSGDYGTWCDFYGCFVVEGTEWLTQGQATGGLVFAF
jgi:hypothetical protein